MHQLEQAVEELVEKYLMDILGVFRVIFVEIIGGSKTGVLKNFPVIIYLEQFLEHSGGVPERIPEQSLEKSIKVFQKFLLDESVEKFLKTLTE